MPSWGEILKEINATPGNQQAGASSFDIVRRKYLAALQLHTGRNVVLYASRWIQGVTPGAEGFVSITDEDIHGFMEVVRDLDGPNLDLVLHSPGGSPEAAEGLVKYLRSKFANIRVIVPQLAMSAATMISCASNEVLLGRHSFLGPTDPQLLLQTGSGRRFVPAQAVLWQFEQAREDCKDKNLWGAWAPILPQYGPDLLVTADNVCRMSAHLVKEWLAQYMFSDLPKKEAKKHATRLAKLLNDHDRMFTHGRHLGFDDLSAAGMRVTRLEADQTLQDAVLSAFHATALLFTTAPACVKVIENHLGKAFLKLSAAPPRPLPAAPNPPLPPAPAPQPS